MNERIKELAVQQGFIGPNYLISSQELEKFAKLIIRECMSLTENHVHCWTQQSASEYIAEHFGIKE